MLVYPLDGTWRTSSVTDGDRGLLIGLDIDDAQWTTIEVPGHWASMADPPTRHGPLLHRRAFSLEPPEVGTRRWIEFDGIFYQADVWLDGAYLGDPEGYFAPHAFDVTALSRLGNDHVLAVEVTCPPTSDGPRRAITGVYQDPHGPALAEPGGIWRSVRIVDTGPVRLDAVRVLCRDADAERAHVLVHARLDSDTGRVVIARTHIDGELVAEHRIALASGANEASWTVDISQPPLWWPRDLGDPQLVDVLVTVEVDGTESDRTLRRTGLRQVRWDDWVCSVNGERIFIKGANLMPISELPGLVSDERARALIDTAIESGLDALRVHGHIANPAMYQAADAAGLMLMQDFPLRGIHSRHVRSTAVRQARAMVDLLGHHPSIVSWWAHDEPGRRPSDGSDEVNEVDLPRRVRAVLTRAGRFARQQAPTWNRSVLDPSIRRAVEQADTTRRCVAHSGVLPHLPLFEGTDSHLYLGWSDGPIDDLPRESARFPRLFRFVSEFGAPAAPRRGQGADALRGGRWPDADWDAVMESTGIDRRHFDDHVPPARYQHLDEWSSATEAHQADVARRWIEHLRRIAYNPTGGFCLRALNDPSATSTWGAVDDEGTARPLAEALRDVCAPVIVVLDRLPASVAPGSRLTIAVHVASDLRSALSTATVTVQVNGPDFESSHHYVGTIDADSCTRVGTVEIAVPERWGHIDIVATLTAGEHRSVFTDRTAIDVPLN